MTISGVGQTAVPMTKAAENAYEFDLPRAAAWGAGGLAVGIGLPLVLNKFGTPRANVGMAGAGAGMAGGALALGIVRPKTEQGAVVTGGIGGAVAGAIGAAAMMAALPGAQTPVALVAGGVLGGAYGILFGATVSSSINAAS